MSRWDDYVNYRVDEKVSKKEIEDSLKNPNILVGAEFEFKLEDGLDSTNDAHEEYARAQADIDSYNDDVREYIREIEAYQKDTDDMKDAIEVFQEKLDKFQELLDDFESYIDERKDDIKELVEIRKELENDLKNETGEISIQEYKNLLKINKEKISIKTTNIKNHRKDKDWWEDEIKKLSRKIESLESDIRDREEDMYEEIETPYLNKHNHSDYFDYMTNWVGYTEHQLYVEPGEEADDPPEWESEGVDNFEEAIENSGILSTAPFSDYNVGTYGSYSPKPGSKTWAVEDDSSLGADGVEVKSPPMPVPKFVDGPLKDMFDWIDKIGYTDSDCGFHCHMSIKNPTRETDYIKLILFTDEGWIYKAFSERAGNFYAKSMKDKIRDNQLLTKKDVDLLFDKQSLIIKSKMAREHYDGISAIDLDEGHVEFRYMGGKDYHKKYKEVKAIIGSMAYNLSLASDPEYKKKEYILKIQRILNKMELYVLREKYEVYSNMLKWEGPDLTDTDKKMLKKLTKETADYIKKLSTYKIDTREEIALRNNKEFYQGMKDGIVDSLKPILSPGFHKISISNFL